MTRRRHPRARASAFCVCVAAFVLASPAGALVPNIVFNQTLTPMDAVMARNPGKWEETFLDMPRESYVQGMVGVGPMRLWANASQWTLFTYPRISISYLGTEFYIFGYREDNNSTTAGPRDQPPMRLTWDKSAGIEGNTTGSSAVDEHGRLGLLADSLVWPTISFVSPDEPQFPLSSAGNASAYEAVDTHNLDPARIGAHTASLSVNYYSRPGGDNLAISHAVVTLMMQSDAKTFDEVPKQTLPFNLDGLPNPAFTYDGEPIAMSYVGGVGGQAPISHPHIDLRQGKAAGYPSVSIPVPVGTGWTPTPPYGRETYDSSLDMNASYVYPGSIMHMMALEPSVNYTLTSKGDAKLDSVTFYGVGNGTTDSNRNEPTPTPDGSPSHSPTSSGGKKLGAGAIAGIVIGGVAGLALVILLAFCAGRRRHKRRATNLDTGKFEIDETEKTPTPFPNHLEKAEEPQPQTRPRPFHFAFPGKNTTPPTAPAVPAAATAPSPPVAADTAAERTKQWVATGFTPSPSEIGPPKPFPSPPASVMSGTTLTPSQAVSGRLACGPAAREAHDAHDPHPHPRTPQRNCCLEDGAHSHNPVADYEWRTPDFGRRETPDTSG